jgi:hypothetical protein
MLQKERKRCVYNTIIKSITTYGCEIWQIKEKIYKNTGFGNGLLAQISKNI